MSSLPERFESVAHLEEFMTAPTRELEAVVLACLSVTAYAAANPIARPIRINFEPCLTIIKSTSRDCAPSASLIPISFVRWATE